MVRVGETCVHLVAERDGNLLGEEAIDRSSVSATNQFVCKSAEGMRVIAPSSWSEERLLAGEERGDAVVLVEVASVMGSRAPGSPAWCDISSPTVIVSLPYGANSGQKSTTGAS